MTDLESRNAKAFDKFADYQVSFAVEMRLRASEDMASGSRWLTASLFALNGAAILAALQIENLPRPMMLHATIAFIFGIAFCLLTVMVSQHALNRRFDLFNQWGDFWAKLLDAKHHFDQDSEAKLRKDLLATNTFSKITWGLESSSLLAFIFGCWLVSRGL